jgi:hypothetical protein
VAAVKILGLSTPPETPEELLNYAVETPQVGTEADVFMVHFVGWVVGRNAKAVALEVLHGDRLLREAPIDRPREDLKDAFAGVPQAVSCGFQVLVGVLGLPAEAELTLRAVLEDGSKVQIASVRLLHEPIRPDLQPRLQPIMLTCLGRTGSTLLMKMLASHPMIVVYRLHPYESFAGKYWAHVLKVLSEPANWSQSSHPFTFSEDIWSIGNIVFYHEGVAAQPELNDWIGRAYVRQLSAFCRMSIDEWYVRVGRSQGQEGALYFAEKHMWPGYMPVFMRELYPSAKEVFLIRDFRDWVHSIMAFSEKRGGYSVRRPPGKTDEQYIREDLREEALNLYESWEARRGDSHLVRYEDIIRRPAETLGALLDYLDLESGPEITERMLAEAAEVDAHVEFHRTSASGEESIGRWQSEGDGALEALCQEVFGDLLEKFGYQATATPEPDVAGGGWRSGSSST